MKRKSEILHSLQKRILEKPQLECLIPYHQIAIIKAGKISEISLEELTSLDLTVN